MKCIVDVMHRDFHSDTSTLKCSREMNFVNSEQFNAYVELLNKNADKNRFYVARDSHKCNEVL